MLYVPCLCFIFALHLTVLLQTPFSSRYAPWNPTEQATIIAKETQSNHVLDPVG